MATYNWALPTKQSNVLPGTASTDAATVGQITANAYSNTISQTFLASGNNSSNIVTTGNISGSYILGNGAGLTGIPQYSNSNVAVYLSSGTNSSNISTTANITTTKYVIGNGAFLWDLPIQYSDANLANLGANTVSTTGNITAGYFVGNGALLTGIAGGYGNANLADIGANAISTTGNISAGYFVGNGALLTGLSGTYSNAEAGAYFAAGVTSNIVTTANISGGYILGNGSQLTGLPAGYSNSNVTSYLPTNTANVGANVHTGNAVSVTGNISGNVFIGNGSQLTGISSYSNSNLADIGANAISTTGNISAGFFIGDGGFLSNVTAGNYSNSNVAAYLPIYTGNLVALTGNVTTTANISGNYILGNGALLTGIAGGNYGNSNLANIGGNSVSTTGNISAGYFLGNGALLSNVYSSNTLVAGTGISIAPASGGGGYIKASYLDVTATGSAAAVTAAAYGLTNLIVFGFADISTPSIDSGYQTAMNRATSNALPGTTFLLSVGGATYDYNTINTSTANSIIANVTAQISSYNTGLTGGQITGVDLDLENGITQDTITALVNGFKGNGFLVSIAPQIIATSGSDISIASPTNLGLSSSGASNQYGAAIATGNVDYILVQTYNSGGFTIGGYGENTVDFFLAAAGALNNCVNSGYQVDIPLTTDIVILEPSNAGAAFNTNNMFGVTGGTSYTQSTTLTALNAAIGTLVSGGYDYIKGVGQWSLNNDYYPSAYGDSYATVGAFTTTIFGNTAPISTGSVTPGPDLVTSTDTLQLVTSRGANTTAAIHITNTTTANSASTGALTVSGGIGAGGNIYASGNISGNYVLGNGALLTGGIAEQAFNIYSANFSPVIGGRYAVDTTSAAVTATLPASPPVGGAIFFTDAAGQYSTHNFIVSSANTIMGVASPMTVSVDNQNFGLFWSGTTWRLY